MTLFSRNSGFTLLELVIAMGLFAVGLMGLVLMTSGLLTHNLTSRQRAAATRLAQNKLEMLSQTTYSEISDGTEEKLDAAGVSGSGVFRREVVVEETTAPTVKEVTVTVSWASKGPQRVTLKTILAP